MEAELRALAADLGLAGRVEFLGYVSDMPSLYADADLVVQSSLTEGLPNVILEAAFLEVPVLATDVGGTREIIEDGRGGRLIEAGSVDSLIEGLRWFLEHTHEARSMTESARQRVMESFSFASRTEKMTHLYEQLAWHRGSHPDLSR
jgi:glycosyltransferase involved in cell wall biosynthesis